MNFERLEDEVKAKVEAPLIAAVPTLEIEVEPEYEGENTPVLTKPRVTIFLGQSEFEKTKSTQYIAQDEDVMVIILVRSRKLRGVGGVYHVLELLRKHLVGFIPKGFSKVWMSKILFEKHERGVWNYSMTIGMRGRVVEEEESNPPKFKTLTVDNQDNNFNN